MNKKNLLLIGVLVAVGFFIYAFNLNNPLFWDDDDWIINNNFVHNISWHNIKFWFTHNTLAGVGLQSNYYRPFLFFTFALNWVLSETKPLLWHLVSNSIHIANAVLIFFLLKRFDLGSPKRSNLGVGTVVAFLTALIFTIHPLNTEAVTYISGRGDPLSVLFILLALLLWTNDIECRYGKTVDNSSQRHSMSLRVLSVISVILAILSRETGVIFPFLLMVFYIAFVAKDRFLPAVKKAFLEALPYFGVVVVYGILRLTVLNFQNTLNFYTAPNPYSENLYYRLLTFMHVLVDYFRLLFVPTGLHMERSMTVHTSLFQWPVWLGAIIVLGIVAVGVLLYKKSRLITSDVGATSDVRIWFFGWSWFFVGLAMVSGITPINAVMYEHWLYLPMIGFWFIVSYYLVKLLDYKGSTFLKIQGSRSGIPTPWELCRTLTIVGLVIYLSFFAYQSIQRNILWGKPVEFFEDILKYEPDSARVSNNLGNLHFNKGDKVKAEEYYRQSAEAGDIFAQPHFNIGGILQSRGDVFGAIKEYEKAIEIDPTFHYSYQNLVVIYAKQGDLVKATEYVEILKQLRSNDPRVYYNAALIYLARNDRDSALENLNQGLKVIGNDPEAGQLIRDLIEGLK